MMPAKLRTALLSVGAAAVTAVTLLGAATPAFAKSDTWLSGPRVAHARQAFHLTVSVGDDAGARPSLARLQLLGKHGRYEWFGSVDRLRLKGRDGASYAFTVNENHPCTVTFRAVVSGYATTNPVTVVVR
jgi:hypothetical protein